MVLMYSPSVYNQSCQWSTVVSFLVNKNNVSSEWSSHLDSTTTTPQPPALQLTGYDVFRCAVVLIVTCGLIGGNLILALAVNGKYSIGILQFQTRCLLTSIATNHVACGLLVTIWDIYPSLTGCWPYGILLCQIQAVLLGSLSQHNSILWILIALDRYIFATRRRCYLKLASSKLCVWIVGVTWIFSFTYYTSIVLPYSAFDYSNDGLAGCEPVPQTGLLMLVSTCLLYFPTTMILLYVYGTVFHSSSSSAAGTADQRRRRRVKAAGSYNDSSCNDHCTEGYCNVKVEESVTRSVATMSLAFVINSTPWIIKQIIVSCLGNEVAPWLDFLITWSSLSLGVWNPLLCWLLCPPIRDGARHVLAKACSCCSSNNYSSDQSTRRSSTWMTDVSAVNGLQMTRTPSGVATITVTTPCEIHHRPNNLQASGGSATSIRDVVIQQLPPPPPPPSAAAVSVLISPVSITRSASSRRIEQDERVWGEILERSLSSGSLHHLQRIQRQHQQQGGRHDDDDEVDRRRNGKPPGNWPI